MKNSNGDLTVESNYPLKNSLPANKRVYNFLPGLQAYPIEIDCTDLHKKELLIRLIG